MFSLEVQWGPPLMGPMLLQEETRVPGESMWCLVELDNTPLTCDQGNFNLITGQCQNQTLVTLVEDTHTTTLPPAPPPAHPSNIGKLQFTKQIKACN